MSPEARALKIAGIVTMFAGIAVLALSVIGMVAELDVVDALEAASGVACTLLGARGARTANVPSSAERFVVPAVVVFLTVAAACVASFLLMRADQLWQAASVAVAVVLAVAVAFAARRIVKALERK